MHRTGLLLLLAALLTASVAARASEEQGALVLVAGATGRTGTHVVAQLLESGYRVRALTRDAERGTQALPAGVELIEGDVREPQSLAGAVREARYVISAVGSNSRRDPANTPEAVDYRGIKALVEASLKAGVEQFILVSSMGTGFVQHPLNRLLDNILLWKALGENSLRYSGLAYTIVRPGGLTDETGGRQGIRIGAARSLQGGSIPRADVAAVCVNALGNTAAVGKTVEIVSAEPPPPADWMNFFAAVALDDQRTLDD